MTDATDMYEQKIAAVEDELAAVKKELRGVQEMLFLVLDEVGEPVNIPALELNERITKDKMISIELDEDTQLWTFKVEVISG
jgi:hypothetical protein